MKQKDPSRAYQKYNQLVKGILLFILCLAIPFVLGRVVGLRKDFYNNLYAPASLLVRGENPYDTSSLEAELPALWSPSAVSLFAPLGLLNEGLATWLWYLTNIAALAVIVFIASGRVVSPALVLIAGGLVFIFPPTISHFVLGQYAIMASLCFILAAHYTAHNQTWLAALLLVLGSAKPQLGFLALIGLVTCAYRLGGAKGSARFAAWVIFFVLITSLPLFITGRTWVASYLTSLKTNPIWPQPSLFSLFYQGLGDWAFLPWGLILIASILASIYLLRVLKPVAAMSWTLGLTTLASPYLWSWDYVLLLPVWLATLARVEWRYRIFLFGVYLTGWLGMAFVQSRANAENRLFWWVPIFFLGSTALAAIKSPDSGFPPVHARLAHS